MRPGEYHVGELLLGPGANRRAIDSGFLTV